MGTYAPAKEAWLHHETRRCEATTATRRWRRVRKSDSGAAPIDHALRLAEEPLRAISCRSHAPVSSRRVRRLFSLSILLILVAFAVPAFAHDIITTPVTWNREISRIFYSRCVACHHEGGRAFSMKEYQETFPWRTAIKEEILERRMPPWGAVKGFGDFRNDQALTPEQLELVTSWSEGGSPEGEAQHLPSKDKLDEFTKESYWYNSVLVKARPGEIVAKGDFKLTKQFVLDGLFPRGVPDGSFQIIAELPDGGVEPLVWLDGYKEEFAHVFLFRSPIELPKGTVITGIPAGSSIVLLPVVEN